MISLDDKQLNEIDELFNKLIKGECVDVDDLQNSTPKQCECGKDKHSFAAHSDWCPKYDSR